MSDYTKFSLEKLDEWIHDLIHNEKLTPSDIYNQVLATAQENFEYHSTYAARCKELMNLLSSTPKQVQQTTTMNTTDSSDRMQKVATMNYKEATALGWTMTDDGFWMPPQKENEKVTKWVLPVQQTIEEGVDDYFINLPDDLLNTVQWKEGDTLEWTSNDDGSYTLKKNEK